MRVAGRTLVALTALVVVTVACGGAPSRGGAAGDVADARAAAAAAERADDAIRAAYATGSAAPLKGVLAGRALAAAQRQVTLLGKTGARREEQLTARRTVHESESGARAEVVLLINARQRVLRPGAPQASFSNAIRQWRATLVRQGGRWMVIDDGDLPPAQWWPV